MRTETYYEPTDQDLKDYATMLSQPATSKISDLPAYKYARHNTTWTEEECEMFACYCNQHKNELGFTQPMDVLAGWFKRHYLGDNW